MNSKTQRNNQIKIKKAFSQNTKEESVSSDKGLDEPKESKVEKIWDENLTTLQKIHAILLNCVNLSKKQKLEFCESQRYFMKLYLKRIIKQEDKEDL